MPAFSKLLGAAAAFVAAASVNAFDMSRSDNAVAYWGQNSIGGSGGTPDQYQKNLGFYCDDDTVDTFLISFLTVFFSTGDMPEIQLANICSNVDNPVFPGTQLPDCSFLEEDIKKCQAKGKIVTLSIGGATGGNVFASDEIAKKFATQVWNLFMGGQSDIRPFGAAVLDAIDLDIEGGSSAGYVAFVEQLRVHYAEDKSKKYYVTAAPQCPFPDAYMGPVLDGADIDAVYIQFYNNYCGVSAAGNPQGFNYETWNEWAETKAPNKNVKLYIGAPGAPGGANAGSYVDPTTLVNLAVETREKFPKHFGGIMYWDISQAAANNGFSKTIKDGIRDGSTPSAPPETQAPSSTEAPPSTSTEVPPSTPTEVPPTTSDEPPAPTTTPPPAGGGEEPTTETPQPTETEDPCPGEEPTTSTEAPAPTETEDPCPGEEPTATPTPNVPEPTETDDPCPEETSNEPEAPSSTSSQPEPTTPSTPPSGDCAGAKPWDASTTYTGGQYATLDGKTYKAKWWTLGEKPSTGGSGVWEEASCGAAKRSFNSAHYRTYKRSNA